MWKKIFMPFWVSYVLCEKSNYCLNIKPSQFVFDPPLMLKQFSFAFYIKVTKFTDAWLFKMIDNTGKEMLQYNYYTKAKSG